EHVPRSRKAGPGKERGPDAGLSRLPGMERLRHGSEIAAQSRSRARRDRQRYFHPCCIEAQDAPRRQRGGKTSESLRCMPAVLVVRGIEGAAELSKQIEADDVGTHQ